MKRVRKSFERRAGFAFIELMVALVILSLVIVGYIGANIQAQRIAEEMNERTIAIQDANRVIEQMRNTSKTAPYLDYVRARYNGTVDGFENLTNELVTVSYINAPSDPQIAVVTVSWLSYTQRQNYESLQTYMTRR